MMGFRKCWLSICLILNVGFISGCSDEVSASSEEIMMNALESSKEVKEYYGEATLNISMDSEESANITMEEYVDKTGKRKIITRDEQENTTYTLNTGEEIITYDEKMKQAFSINIQQDELPSSMSPKDQVRTLLNGLSETHSIEVVGEEEISGRETFHLKASPKKDDSLLGKMEFWVDKKSWFTLKSISYSGNSRTEIIYDKINFDPSFSKDTFTLDIPKDIEVEVLDVGNQSQTSSLEEAEKALGKKILLFTGESTTLESIEIEKIGGELNRTEVYMTYFEDSIPAFSVSVFETPNGEGMSIHSSKWKVRGHVTEYDELIRTLSWDENGLRYVVMIQNPDLSVDDVVQKTETLKIQ